jgi:predicted permease
MIDILAITAPIYIIILIGYLLTRFGLFAKTDIRGFGKFVVNVALPALLFKALSERHFAEIINVSYLLAYATGSFLVMGAVIFGVDAYRARVH